MGYDPSLVKGACGILDAVLFENKKIGCWCSGADLWKKQPCGTSDLAEQRNLVEARRTVD